jgi:hypothetical protein
MSAIIWSPGTNGTGFIGRHPRVLELMLALGVLAPIYFVVVNDVVAAMRYPGYDRLSRPVSELSASYAPSRPVLVPLLVIFELLMIAFWIGVWRRAQGNRALRLTSGLMLGFAALGVLAFPFYAILTLVAIVAFSVVAGSQAAQINAGEPVFWFGVTERALIAPWLVWVAVLALALLRVPREWPPAGRGGRSGSTQTKSVSTAW